MITLREITTEEMLEECLELSVTEEQEEHVDDVSVSLAMAWFHGEAVKPYAIYNDEVMIGFIMLIVDRKNNECEIWEFVIDKKHQGKGYGKNATKVVIEHIKKEFSCNNIFLSVFPENKVAIKVYERCGFSFTGESVEDEVVMHLTE